MHRIPLWLFVVVTSACSPGSISGGIDDAGCSEPECTDGDPGDADRARDSEPDPCDLLSCPSGQECIEGWCRTIDLCHGVTCENPGEVCDPRNGECRPSDTDEDGDGYTIGEGDCDDGDPLVHPAAEELCDSADQDCDRDVDEGFDDTDGDGFDICGGGDPARVDCDDTTALRCPGCPESCDSLDNDCNGAIDDIVERVCATSCGEGVERCEGGAWVCSAPATCDCAIVGEVEEESCGLCGTRQRTCAGDRSWGDWGACSGEGECSPDESESEACGSCGTRRRGCDATCHWGGFGGCTDEGACASGESESEPCGRCGTRRRACDDTCNWEPFGGCTGEGECEAGRDGSCTTSCGSSGSRSCDGSCRWGSCQPPSESCNGGDDDCDGLCDEGCRLPIHRAYSSSANDHFYTTNLAEASCCGYRLEYENFFYLSRTRIAGSTELWRCWNASQGDHFYTASSSCEGAAGAVRESSLGFMVTSATCGAEPLYRLRIAGDHFYTMSTFERDEALTHGWVSEGVTGYVWRTP